MTKYWHHLQSSWTELEERFRRGEVEPQQENDVVCYLYHALVKRLEREGKPPKIIRTEDSFPRIGRADLNIGDRLVIEVKILARQNYAKKGWRNNLGQLYKAVRKLTIRERDRECRYT